MPPCSPPPATASCQTSAVALYVVMCSQVHDEMMILNYEHLRTLLGNRNSPGRAGNTAITSALSELWPPDSSKSMWTPMISAAAPTGCCAAGRPPASTKQERTRSQPSWVGSAPDRSPWLSPWPAMLTATALSTLPGGMLPARADLAAMTRLSRNPTMAALKPLRAAGFIRSQRLLAAASAFEAERFEIILTRGGAPAQPQPSPPTIEHAPPNVQASVGKAQPQPQASEPADESAWPPAETDEVVVGEIDDEWLAEIEADFERQEMWDNDALKIAMRACEHGRQQTLLMLEEAMASGVSLNAEQGAAIFTVTADIEGLARDRAPDWESALKHWITAAAKTLRQKDPVGAYRGYMTKCWMTYAQKNGLEVKQTKASGGGDIAQAFETTVRTLSDVANERQT